MKAVRIPTLGPVQIIDLAVSEDDDPTAFLADLYAAIGCRSVECVELTSVCDMWVDETGLIEGRVVNHRGTLLSQLYGFPYRVFGDVVVTGANDDLGQPVGLTDDQAESIARRVDGLEAAGYGGPDVQANLRHLLNAWDPIGVADVVDDEYDCMIGPLLRRLGTGGRGAEISEFLWTELENHFDLDPHRYNVDKIANELVAWWAARASS